MGLDTVAVGWERLTPAPPDPIHSVVGLLRADPRPDTVNLVLGGYRDELGRVPVFAAVREAEKRLLAEEASKDYAPIEGWAPVVAAMQGLAFGAIAEASSGRIVSAHTPGGTGAVWAAASVVAQAAPGATAWVSDPTWPGHHGIFERAGLEVRTYPYRGRDGGGFDPEPTLEALAQVVPGDVVVLHGCGHNPTGTDPTAEDWQRIASALATARAIPIVDLAYQGLVAGIDGDRVAIEALDAAMPSFVVAAANSKNFGLYNERVGSVHVVLPEASPTVAAVVLGRLRAVARTAWSNPPARGGAIVAAILADAELRAMWDAELGAMRDRLAAVRTELVAALQGVGLDPGTVAPGDAGLFSRLGLSPAQAARLRERHGIYVLDNGRANIAGLSSATIPRFAEALSSVLAEG